MSNQQCLMPSEIARLTYGYLLETNCPQTAQIFLDESPYLREFAQGIKNGLQYSTKPYSMSLIETLNGRFSQTINTNHSTSYSNLFDDKTIINDATTGSSNKNRETNPSTPKNKILQSRDLNAYSPRRKSTTPRRLLNQQQQSYGRRQQQQQQQQLQNYNQQTTTTTMVPNCQQLTTVSSSPMSSMACESSEIDIEVQPQTIFDELLKYSPLHDKVANTIQRIIDVKDNDVQVTQQQQTSTNDNDAVKNCSNNNNKNNNNNENVDKIVDIEKDLLPADQMDELLSSLAEEPEFQNFVQIVVEKEIANTPYKSSSINNPPSNASTSSLNTPNIMSTPQPPVAINNDSKTKNSTMPLKNLIYELKTPEKTSTIKNSYQQQQNSQAINQTAKIKPILQNHNFIPKFTQVSNKQKEVHEQLKKNKQDKPLTTSIEIVEDNDNDKNSINPVNNKDNVEILSIENWNTSTNNMIQPVVIPNNHQSIAAWNQQQGVVYLYPTTAATTQETVYYIDSSSLNLIDTTTIVDQQHQEQMNKSIELTQNNRMQSSTTTTMKTIPSILSKGSKRFSKNVQQQLESTTRKADANCIITNNKKRHLSGSNSDEQQQTNKRPDKQVEKFLGSNIDEFLTNYHNNNNNKKDKK